MLQNSCPPMIKIEVGKMQGLSYVFTTVAEPAIGGHFALKADFSNVKFGLHNAEF